MFVVKSGLTALISHSKCERHKRISETRKTTKPLTFTSVTKVDSSHADGAKKAEIRWTVFVLEKNISFESQKEIVSNFKVMFVDSKVPFEMRLQEDKIKYLITDAIFPYLQNAHVEEIKQSAHFSIYIDEANKMKSYLAVVIRYFVQDSWNLKTVL